MVIKNIADKIFDFVKNETVLCAASVLAVISSFIVKPDANYLSYIDFRTLALLLCLMSVMAETTTISFSFSALFFMYFAIFDIFFLLPRLFPPNLKTIIFLSPDINL